MYSQLAVHIGSMNTFTSSGRIHFYIFKIYFYIQNNDVLLSVHWNSQLVIAWGIPLG